MAEADEVVVTTGAAGNLGRLMVQALHRSHQVVAIDRRPIRGLPKDVTHLRTDIRQRRIENIFRTRKVKAVYHLGLMHNPRGEEGKYRFNVVGTQRLLSLVAKYEVEKLVMLSSANIYGPDPDNSYFLTEDAPLLGADHHPEIRDLVAVDRLVQNFFYREPAVSTVMLRPVHIVGPRVRNTASRYLRLPRPWVIMGFDPMVQLIHEEDVVAAMLAAGRPGVRGIYNVVGGDASPLSRVFRVLGRRVISVPASIARRLVARGFQTHLLSFPPEEIRHIQFNCVVDGGLAKDALDFVPRFSVVETIRSVDALAA